MGRERRELKYPRPNRHGIRYESLRYRKYRSTSLKPVAARPVSAIDTETYKGEARLISDSFGNYLYDADVDAILHFLTHNRFRHNHIFSYNLKFDAEAVLKMLPRHNVQDLVDTGQTDYSVFHLKYIPGKLWTIRDRHRHTSRLFDLAQFYEMKLETAVEKYLGLHKIDYPYTKRLNTDLRIWKKDFPNILRYNRHDSKITALLAEHLQHNITDLFDFNARSYISKASLAKDLVRIRGYIPDVLKLPPGVNKMAFYAYKGGRFEVLQRGKFDQTVLYDIVSAYPDKIRRLIDVTYGEWRKTRDLHEDATYGFYICQVFVMPHHLCPLAYFLPNKVVCFPAGKFLTYLTKQEIEAYQNVADIQVLHGWEFYPSRIRYPFRRYIDMLFEQKQHYAKDDYKYDLVKKMMNALYGTFGEKVKYPDYYQTGALFHPAYFSMITADTRIQLYETARRYEQDVIALQTDSILFNGKVDLPVSKVLGGWSRENEGEAVVLQSGIYRLSGKLRLRGMQHGHDIIYRRKKYKDVFHVIAANPEPTKYPLTIVRPLHVRECMKQTGKHSLEDVNVWTRLKKTVNVNADVKRRWSEAFTRGGDIFTCNQQSEPWQFYQ